MKSLGRKGFTLIELLAVITIMGILMLVAIPAVSRTIENSRRDTFASVAAEYMNAVRNGVLADEIECYYGANWVVASATPNGTYYFPICTSETDCTDVATGKLEKSSIKTSTTDLLESGGKSSFGSADIKGYVIWEKKDDGSGDTKKTKMTYKILIQDTGKHGFDAEKTAEELKRSNVITKIADDKITTNKPTTTTDGYCKVR